MSTCNDIMNKLNTLETTVNTINTNQSNNYTAIASQLSFVIENINDFETRLNQSLDYITDGLIESNSNLLETSILLHNQIQENILTMNKEQLLQSEALKTIGLSLSNLDSISSKNNLFLQKISKFKIYSNDFLTQIANIEAVSKELNKVYLGGSDGTQ